MTGKFTLKLFALSYKLQARLLPNFTRQGGTSCEEGVSKMLKSIYCLSATTLNFLLMIT